MSFTSASPSVSLEWRTRRSGFRAGVRNDDDGDGDPFLDIRYLFVRL
jgi:hypothetical protein